MTRRMTLLRAPARVVITGVFAALALNPAAASAGSVLGSADTFGVLAATTVTNVGMSSVSGSVGVVSPENNAVTGFLAENPIVGPGAVVPGDAFVFAPGTIYAGSVDAARARNDAFLAYADLQALPCPPANNLTGKNLGGLTLTPGVYCFDTPAGLNGNLILDGQSKADAVFVFQFASTLTTGSGAWVTMANGTLLDGNVFWQVGTSVTVGVSNQLSGSFLALSNITLGGGSNMTGRVLALTGAVTMDTTNIVVPPALLVAPAPAPATAPATAPVCAPAGDGDRDSKDGKREDGSKNKSKDNDKDKEKSSKSSGKK